jgi:hypothetical protein
MCGVVELAGCPDVPTKIFATACGTKMCHGNAQEPPLGFTDLGHSTRDITERLLDLHGTLGEKCADGKVIDTADPESSLLITKLDPTPACGLPMPFGVYQVSDTDRECIRRWTRAVAKRQITRVKCQ